MKDSDKATSPLMRQYQGIKKEYPDMLLLFRMGDFYELFYDDAARAASLLNITLTRRKSSGGDSIPMAGVPAHSVDQYLARLVKMGESAAICEQQGEATSRKGLMRRAVTRVITPGTLADAGLLDNEQPCVLFALAPNGGYAWLDLSRGMFCAGASHSADDIIARVRPAELLLPETMNPPSDGAVKYIPEWEFKPAETARFLCDHFGVRDLQGFGFNFSEDASAIAAAGALLRYALNVCKQPLKDISGLRRETGEDFLGMTAATRHSLELTETLSGERSPTLFSVMNHCRTPMGTRLLSYVLHHPPQRATEALPRQAAVDALRISGSFRPVQRALNSCPDIERIAASISLYSVRPRELVAMRGIMQRMPEVAEGIRPAAAASEKLKELEDACTPVPEALSILEKVLAEDPAAVVRAGDVIADGFDSELDEWRVLCRDAKAGLKEMDARIREQIGVEGVRIEYNKVYGFFIELTKAQAVHAPADWQRRQTLKSAERFVTPELKRHEERVLVAEEKSRAREKVLYDQMLKDLQPHVPALRRLATALAELDIIACFALVADDLNWRMPELTDESELRIAGGRHPVVESQSDHFVGNDLALNDESRLHIITGPNMGGKSTYLRQTALIVILARIGSFVPADRACIGGISQIFTRIGAADDLAGGRSTFMVEMTEAAEILHNADTRSLVLLDELGRGTSTFDGMALAWALAEELLQKNRSLTMFATHYFELTALADEFPEAINRHLTLAEHGDDIVFLHRVEDGASNRSYGLQVAKIAGMPPTALARAAELLDTFERPERAMPLFDPSSAADKASPASPHPVLEKIRSAKPDSLTPREAHDMLYELKNLVDRES